MRSFFMSPPPSIVTLIPLIVLGPLTATLSDHRRCLCFGLGRIRPIARPRNTLRFAYLKGDNYCGSRGTVRVPMLVRCVHCGTDLVAPVRSEYWSDNHACHIWHCPKCCACFSSLVSFSDDTD